MLDLRLALTDALLRLAERTLGPATRPQVTPRAAPALPTGYTRTGRPARACGAVGRAVEVRA
jgi:hypothetical protein